MYSKIPFKMNELMYIYHIHTQCKMNPVSRYMSTISMNECAVVWCQNKQYNDNTKSISKQSLHRKCKHNPMT